MKLATWHWHIEVSSKCTLKCARCARSEVPDTLVNTELSLEFFKKNFTPEFIVKNVEKITFCGDDGDPIYAREFIQIVKYLKSVKPIKIVIVTNGSYKSADWWKSLASALTDKDHIHFSLDGWDQQSNSQYRENSNWDSILTGITAVRENSSVFMTWDAIAFSFNENQIELMKTIAASLGFDQFQLTLSTKFNKVYPVYPANDLLQPSNNFISGSHRFERQFFPLSTRTEYNIEFSIAKTLFNNNITTNNVTPLCSIGNKGLFINSQGLLFPCCWVANRYNHNNEWQQISKKFNLNSRSLSEILLDKFWSTDFTQFKWNECQTKCSRSVVTEKYATEW